MTAWTNLSMIVAASQAPLARSICETLAPVGGSGMFAVGLSADGTGEPSHFISAGMIETAFADLLPLTTRDQEGIETTAPGNPEAIVYLATQAGLSVSLEDVQALLAACDVTREADVSPRARLEQLGLAIVQPAETA